jgi:hypothetical protein
MSRARGSRGSAADRNLLNLLKAFRDLKAVEGGTDSDGHAERQQPEYEAQRRLTHRRRKLSHLRRYSRSIHERNRFTNFDSSWRRYCAYEYNRANHCYYFESFHFFP